MPKVKSKLETIKRSAGTVVTVGSIPYIVGGGYEGSTQELDETVKLEAELLAKTFHKDIEIRFNSDRGSGGAWLVNSLKGFDGNCQVGFCAELVAITPEGMTRSEFLVNSTSEFIRNQPKEIYIATNIKPSALKNPELVNSGNPDSRYCWLTHKSIEIALDWLIANVDKKRILK